MATLAASDHAHHFETVAVLEQDLGVLVLMQDLAVTGYGHEGEDEVVGFQELLDAQSRVRRTLLAINREP
jgi:hypothetical protein